jgi:hypothetical protein
VIRDPVGQIEPAKPAIRQVQMHLLAQTPFRPDAEAIANQQHTDQKFGIDRRATRVAIEISNMRANATQIDETINRSLYLSFAVLSFA